MDIVNNVSARFVMDQYVSLDLPVVVKDEMQDWPATNLENIIQVFFKTVILRNIFLFYVKLWKVGLPTRRFRMGTMPVDE